jgi:hypothetical protein
MLDLDPVYGTASRISEIKANYYMGTKEKKYLSSSIATAVLDLDSMLPRFAFPALGADPFQF